MAYDEFSVSAYPTLYYGWAAINSKPQIRWDKNQTRHRITGFLAVDMKDGDEFLAVGAHGKTEMVVEYFYELALYSQQQGYRQLTVILDNNATHKDGMRYNLWLKLKNNPALIDFSIRFISTPTYSPDYNLAEYVIRLLRLKLLHHLPIQSSLTQVIDKLAQRFAPHMPSLLSPQQISNIVDHILNLAPKSPLLSSSSPNTN